VSLQAPKRSHSSSTTVGLSDWTTGYQAAFANLTRNILVFLGILATGRRITWEAVTVVKVKGDRVVQNYTLLDLWGIYQQMTAPMPQP
jgi:hypothetical protein